jgi:phage-related baseplate assembly protein
MLGFTDRNAMEAFFNGDDVKKLSDRISVFCSAVNAYEISETITYVKDGKRISN